MPKTIDFIDCKSSPFLRIFFALALLASISPLAATSSKASASQSLPTLKLASALYKVGPGILEFSFTFVNPTDSVLYLDCQVPPKFALRGKTLLLTLDRAPAAMPSKPGAAKDSAKADGQNGSPAVDLAAFPPQRIAAHQTFQGQRRFDHILGEAEVRPAFSTLRLEMVYYPERSEGEGEPFVQERGTAVNAPPMPVPRRGKPPSPPAKIRIVHPLDP